MDTTARQPDIDTVSSPPARLHETMTLVSDTNNVAVARRFVRSVLAWCGATDLVGDLELASSELVTNAIEHGLGRVVDVTIRCDGEQVWLSVTSRGNSEQVDPTGAWRIAGADAITGRGLGIVRTLADHVDVRRRSDELTITVARRIPA